MDRAAALLSALRAKSALSGGRVSPADAEALGLALGIAPHEMPGVAAQLQREGRVALRWGGEVEVLAEASAASQAGPAGGAVFHMPNATFGHGATFAGGNATGGTVLAAPEVAVGQLAAALAELRRLRPDLDGAGAAEAAEAAERALAEAATVASAPAGAPAAPEAKRGAAERAGAALKALLEAAPKAKALVEIGEKAVKLLG